MSHLPKIGRGVLAAVLYVVITAVFVFSVGAYFQSQVDQLRGNPSAAGMVIFVFGVSAFFLGPILFAMLDWGLKILWKKRSLWGIIPIAIALSIPFIWEYYHVPRHNDFFLPTISAIGLLLGSILVVSLQLWLEALMNKQEKAKHGE